MVKENIAIGIVNVDQASVLQFCFSVMQLKLFFLQLQLFLLFHPLLFCCVSPFNVDFSGQEQ